MLEKLKLILTINKTKVQEIEVNVIDGHIYFDYIINGIVISKNDSNPAIKEENWIKMEEGLGIENWYQFYDKGVNDDFDVLKLQNQIDMSSFGKECDDEFINKVININDKVFSKNPNWIVIEKNRGDDEIIRCGKNVIPVSLTRLFEMLEILVPKAYIIRSDRLDSLVLIYDRHINSSNGGWNYSEVLVIDREKGRITYNSKNTYANESSSTFEVGKKCHDLLDELDENIKTMKKTPMPIRNEGTPMMKMLVQRHSGDFKSHYFSYDRYGVPKFWHDAVRSIKSEIGRVMPTDIFDKDIYGHGCKSGEYIYCSVSLNPDDSRTFYYLTLDNSLMSGDLVIVGFGKEDEITLGRIEKIEYYNKENVPYPPHKMKYIIRKASYDDLAKFLFKDGQ